MSSSGTAVLVGDGHDENFSGMIDAWRLAFEPTIPDLSLSPQWTSIAARSAGLAPALRMIAIRDSQGSLQSFASFVETRESQYGIPVRLRELPGNRLVAYHNELPGAAVRDLIIAIVRAGNRSCDVVHLPMVERDSRTDSVIREVAREQGWRVLRIPGNRSPHFGISGTWEAYLAGKSKNFRYTLNRKRKALAAHGPVRSVRYERPESVAELLGFIQTIEASSWKASADMAITDSAQEMAYYRELLPWLAEKGALAANVTLVADEPVAYSLCCNWRGRFAQLKTSFVERLSKESPGLVVNADSIQYAFEAGAHEFDFLGDVMPHKEHWTSELRQYDHLFLYTGTLTGRALGLTKQLGQRLRPAKAPTTTGRSGRRTANA